MGPEMAERPQEGRNSDSRGLVQLLTGEGRLGNRLGYTTMALIGIAIAIEVGNAVLPEFLFPSVIEVGAAITAIAQEDASHLGATTLRFVLAICTAVAAGWAIGLVMGIFRHSVGKLLQPYLKVLLSTPALFWILVAVIWFVSVELRIWFIAFILCMPFFATAVHEAIANIDDEIAGGMQQFAPTRWQNALYLMVPYSTVAVFASLQSVSGYAFRIIVFAELVGAASGVGVMMGRAQSLFRVDYIFAWAICLITLNYVFTMLMKVAERIVLRWRPPGAVA